MIQSHRETAEAPIGHPDSENAAWRPIETAPKDGTHILAYDPEGLHGPVYAVVNWYVHKGETFKETETDGLYRREEYETPWWDGASYTPFRATHWMPLPAAPAPASGLVGDRSEASTNSLED